MELLFKEETFSREFRELLGFVDADIRFKSVRSELLTATREMIALIGKSTYEGFVAIYKKEGILSADESEQLQLIRYPLAMNTYKMSAPSKDLQHTNQGRMMRTDEHQARPFPWMIDRNNAANEKKYYRGVDDLLEYLFAQNAFKQTNEYKKIKSLFISSTSDFEEYYPIHSRLLLIKLQPGIRQAMRDFIAPRIGESAYLSLLTDYKSQAGIKPEDEPLMELIKEACVYHSLQWAMSRLTVNLLPEGILQQYQGDRNNTKASKTPEMLQARLADQKFGEDAARALKAIERYIQSVQPVIEDKVEENYYREQDDDLFATT